MHNICKWISEVALAKNGFDSNKLDSQSEITRFVESQPLFKPQYEALMALPDLRYTTNGTKFVETMTVAHFDAYFTDALSRAFYTDYQYKVGQWRDYTYADTVPDFRDVKRFRMTEPGTLYKRREKQEAAATYVADSVIEYGVEPYARQFDVSWQAIVNDDLGKIRETPQRMASAAARWLDGWVSALYDNATTQFTIAGLGAPWSGTGRLTAANLAIGINAMMQRTDVNGNQMNIRNIWLVIPPILEMQARVLLNSTLLPGTPNNDLNVLPGFIRGYRIDPYITTAAPDVPWYLFADPSEIQTVPVARLQGMPAPVVVMKRSNIQQVIGTAPAAFLMGSFETGDIEYLVQDVIGGWDDASYVGVADYRGLYYSSGTTL
jgi:hypothetical protein